MSIFWIQGLISISCSYKGLLPACARKAHWQSANCTTFSAALKMAYQCFFLTAQPQKGLAGLLWLPTTSPRGLFLVFLHRLTRERVYILYKWHLSVCTWSSMHSASIISIPFLRHNEPNICPTSASISLQITYRRYFGAKTRWCLQTYFYSSIGVL